MIKYNLVLKVLGGLIFYASLAADFEPVRVQAYFLYLYFPAKLSYEIRRNNAHILYSPLIDQVFVQPKQFNSNKNYEAIIKVTSHQIMRSSLMKFKSNLLKVFLYFWSRLNGFLLDDSKHVQKKKVNAYRKRNYSSYCL